MTLWGVAIKKWPVGSSTPYGGIRPQRDKHKVNAIAERQQHNVNMASLSLLSQHLSTQENARGSLSWHYVHPFHVRPLLPPPSSTSTYAFRITPSTHAVVNSQPCSSSYRTWGKAPERKCWFASLPDRFFPWAPSVRGSAAACCPGKKHAASMKITHKTQSGNEANQHRCVRAAFLHMFDMKSIPRRDPE